MAQSSSNARSRGSSGWQRNEQPAGGALPLITCPGCKSMEVIRLVAKEGKKEYEEFLGVERDEIQEQEVIEEDLISKNDASVDLLDAFVTMRQEVDVLKKQVEELRSKGGNIQSQMPEWAKVVVVLACVNALLVVLGILVHLMK